MSRRLRGILCVLGGVLTFSSSSSIVKWADTPGSAIAFWRLLLSVILWWIVLSVARIWRGRPFPSAATWRAMMLPGICFGLNITLFFTAITRTSIAHAEFITALSPLLLVPAGALLFHEHIDHRALAWGVVTAGGLAIVVFSGGGQGGASLSGDLLVLCVVVMWVAYLLTGRRARATVDVTDFMATVMPIGFVVAAPLALVISGDAVWNMSSRGWASAALLSVLTGMLAHGLVAAAQRDVDVGTISILQVSQPALAVCWAYVLIDEEIRLAQVPGMVLVILGLIAFTIVSQRGASRRAAADAGAGAEAVPAAAAAGSGRGG